MRFNRQNPTMASNTNLWPDRDHALQYLAIADQLPHRTEGEGVLLDHLPEGVGRVLDLGTGDGRLLALVLATRPDVTGIGLDFSDEMLERAQERFADDDRVEIRRHDLNERLPDLGVIDAVVSSFAIHHVDDARKREVYAEAHDALVPGGVFLNLEHVASATERLHEQFRVAIGHAEKPDDPSNLLAPVDAQLDWLRDVGFEDVDCHWKWLELALLAGVRA